MRPTSYNSRIPSRILRCPSRGGRARVPRCWPLALACAQDACRHPSRRRTRVNERIRASAARSRAPGAARRARSSAICASSRSSATSRANRRSRRLPQPRTPSASLRDTTDRLSQLELQRLAQLPDMKRQLVDMYKRGRSGYARLLFGARRSARIRAGPRAPSPRWRPSTRSGSPNTGARSRRCARSERRSRRQARELQATRGGSATGARRRRSRRRGTGRR